MNNIPDRPLERDQYIKESEAPDFDDLSYDEKNKLLDELFLREPHDIQLMMHDNETLDKVIAIVHKIWKVTKNIDKELDPSTGVKLSQEWNKALITTLKGTAQCELVDRHNATKSVLQEDYEL